jgi:dihydrofolate synthase/folylpolyglutamate synthase
LIRKKTTRRPQSIEGKTTRRFGYRQAVKYLYGLDRFGIKLGLENTRILMRHLESPHRKFPSVLIGGTNGKGSVGAMMASALTSAGYRTGLFTSPHLQEMSERFCIDGNPLEKERIAQAVAEVRRVTEGLLLSGRLPRHPTFFEMVTAAGFLLFAESKVDVAVLEVGLGGRLDATNVVDPIISIITGIGLDHTSVLGDSLEEIALEKAGIMRRAGVLVTAEAEPAPLRLLEERAGKLGSGFHRITPADCLEVRAIGPRGSVVVAAEGVLQDGAGSFTLEVPLPGRHQVRNALVALKGLALLRDRGFGRLTRARLREGIRTARWPGRLEYVSAAPPLLLDGAHNVQAVETLCVYLSEFGTKPMGLIFAIMRDKDVKGVTEKLFPLFDEIFLTRLAYRRSLPPREIEKEAGLAGKCRKFPRSKRALDAAFSWAGRTKLLVAAGSIYLIGEVKSALEGKGVPRHLP